MSSLSFARWLSTPSPGEEVVISGVSGHLPESDNVYEFRDNLFNKKDMVTDDDRRWKVDHPEIPKRTAKIYNIDKFDAGFFGIHHRQADVMDPMMRKFLETTIEAIMDAGINPSELAGTKTGVFVGACYSDMECELLSHVTEPQRFALTGYLRSFLPNRISYYLKLKGPSVVVDTACSSSLNALEQAFKSIRNGQCDYAIVAGVNLLLHPGVTLQFARLGVLSIDGVCKVFDQDANGYVRSEAIACILLQKAKNAKRIYSEVIYAKVNCDGFKPQGITFPSTQMQKELMNEVLEDSATNPSDLNYIEAHGTGTEVGDPQEVEAIDLAIAKKRNKPLWIGSVKCNIGHSEPASGLCSLIKVIIAMETGLIAPNINIKNLKRGMEGFDKGRLKLVTELTKLEGDEVLVGINNFGFGGNNCHMVARRFRKKKERKVDDGIPRLICVGGRTEEAVLEVIKDINRRPLDNEYVGLLHQIFKKEFNYHYRGYTIVSPKGVINSCVKVSRYTTPLYVFFGFLTKNVNVLGNQLLTFPVFQATISRINKLLKHVDVFDILKNGKNENKVLTAAVIQIGFVNFLKHLEIKPIAVFGESIGRIIAAYYYEVINLQDTLFNILKLTEKSSKKINFDNIFTNFALPQCTDDSDYRNLYRSNSIVLNLSDETISRNDLLLAQEKSKFLDILGRLYLEGHNPQLYKLYPPVQFPVSRNTPMISPLIKWNHKKSWYTYKFKEFQGVTAQQSDYTISYNHEHSRYVTGHVVDGRNLIPAMEYLYLVWLTFAKSRRLLITDIPVVFENCKFIRAVTLTKTNIIKLMVFIQEGSGNFEIIEKDSLVVSGKIYSPKDIDLHKNTLTNITMGETDRSMYLEQDEIYRELYLRGYNYSGLFKGIVKSNVDATCGLIKWENNWTTFMDKMLQMSILHFDTRSLYVPVGIRKVVIDPIKHLSLTDKDRSLLPVNVHSESNIIKSGEIEIIGLQAKAIAKRKPAFEPVLEKYTFIPNQAHFSVEEVIRINTQIVLEHSMETNFKSVEVVDESTNSDSEFLLPLVNVVLDNVPLVNPELTISTKEALKYIPNIKIENLVLSSSSNLALIIGSKLLERTTLRPSLSALSANGFILSREEIASSPTNIENIEIVTEYVTEKEKLVLFRKSEPIENVKCIEITSNDFQWLLQVQNALKYEKNIIVYSQDEELSGIIGLVNCIRREPGGTKVKCFFITSDAPKFDPQLPFYQKQINKRLAVNVYRNSQWGTYRHLLLEDSPEITSEYFYVNSTIKGDLSSLKWIQRSLTPQTSLKENKILIYNYYSSINFKDIMLASGRISADSITTDRIEQECLLGFEFSGRDSSGRRVYGMVTSGAMSTHSIADVNFLWNVPDSWTFEQAATIPTVYSTVLYGLLQIARVKRGMSILIHSATGGVGLAAINVCLYFGCTIFATVGTPEKKKYLEEQYPQIPISHIGNSHDTSFEEMIKTQTNGRGVDIVLNSLAEEKLMASVRCLAKRGQFLEIGKFDLYNDNSLSLLLLEKQISYHGVMMDKIYTESDKIRKWLINTIYKGIEVGFVKPLPVTVFQPDEIEKAFRYMTTGKHMGKVIIKIREEEEEKIVKPREVRLLGVPRFDCDVEKCYIIVGGLGGFGMELADWLVLRGARNLVLVSSSGIKTGYQRQRIKIWKSYGVNIQISTADVTTKEGCRQLLQESKKYGPIDAIFNLAAVLRDALFEDQTEEKFQISLSPKAQATKFLDEISRVLCPNLRYFVVFSSVSCGRGNIGQTNYGMANSIMERICEKRKRDGYPALAIQWGAIGEVGLVAKMQKENKELIIGGTLQQKVSSCLEALDKFLNQENPIVASMIVAEKHSKDSSASAVETIARALGIKDLNKVNKNATFAELGMDSMTGTELIHLLEKDFEIYVSAKEIRSLTLARIHELEMEKTGIVETKIESKTEKSVNMLLQYIPDSKTIKLPVVKLPSKSTNEKTTVFMLSGIEGVLTPLESLSRKLNANVLALQYSYDNPEDSIEDTAKTMLPRVEEVIGKNQKFFIVSYSYGTAVAIELVALLESKGYSGTVVLIDGSPSYLLSAVKDFLVYQTESEFETNLLAKLLAFVLPVDVVMQKKDELLKFTSFDEKIDRALTMVPKHLADVKLERQGVIVIYKRFKSVFNYKFAHEKIKSSVYLYKAEYPIVPNMVDDYGLSELCAKQVEITELDSDHASILKHSKLVEDLNTLLQSKNVN